MMPTRAIRIGLFCLALCLPALAAQRLWAQETPAAPLSAWVSLDGAQVLQVQASFKNLTPAVRAERIEQRLRQLAPTWPVVPLQVSETDISTDVYMGETLILSVFDADAQAAGQERMALAESHLGKIRAAFTAYHENHGRAAFLLGLAKTAGTIVVVSVLLLLWGRLHRRLRGAVLSHAEAKFQLVDQKTFGLVRMEHLRMPLLGLLNGVRMVVWLVAIYLAIDLCLSYFPQTRSLAAHLTALVLAPLAGLGSAFLYALPKLFVLLVVVWVVRYLLRTSAFFFERLADGRIELQGFYADWAAPTRRIVNLLIIIAGVMVAYPYIPGSSSDAFKGISIFLGVLLSIGSSGIIANLMTGLTITYMRAFKVGDFVKIGDTLGTVVESSLLVTRLKTPKGLEITLPNAQIMAGQVVNFSASRQPYLTTVVTIGYDAPWRQVHAMLRLAAERTEGVLATPAPLVIQSSLDDFYVRYELNVVVDDPARQGRILSVLHQHIQDVFNEHGVQIMSPNFEAQPEQAVLVPKARWHDAPAIQE